MAFINRLHTFTYYLFIVFNLTLVLNVYTFEINFPDN